MKRIGFITSGGDSPGMNAVIRAVVKASGYYNIETYGYYGGFEGLVENKFKQFKYSDVNNIIQTGGTILSSSRSDEFRSKEGRMKAYNNLIDNQIDGLIVIGGDGSLRGGLVFSEEFNFPVIGVPATIDNDLFGTDYAIGFDTAINTVVESIDRIRDTANSHHRMFFVEVMGRNSGFIALHAAIASGAEMVLIPEEDVDFEEFAGDLCSLNKGNRGSIFVVAEGEKYGGVEMLIKKLEPHFCDFEVRSVVLGHIQRGGRPSAFDRILATRLGVEAVENLIKGMSKVMVGFIKNKVVMTSMNEATNKTNSISNDDLQILDVLLTRDNK